MALNDFVRIRKDASGVHIDLRNDPGNPEPTQTLRAGYTILGGPPADDSVVEGGAIWFDPETGRVMVRDINGTRAVATEAVP